LEQPAFDQYSPKENLILTMGGKKKETKEERKKKMVWTCSEDALVMRGLHV